MLQSIMGYGYPPGVCPMAFWVMLQSILGYGYPPRCLPHGILGNVQSIMGYGYPPVSAPWHSGKCCKVLWDMGTPPCGQTEGQTRVKTLPSHRTTYADGN